jgi:hypothetical protein
MKEFWTIVAKDYVQHIQDNAEVPPGISVNASGYTGATTSAGEVK